MKKQILKSTKTPEVKTIHDKYRDKLNKISTGIQLNINEKFEILRWCEATLGHKIPTQLNCGTCVYNLFMLFKNLEK